MRHIGLSAFLLAGLPLLALTSACSQELSGPEPSVSAVDPPLVCTEQLTTSVAIDGSDLAPTVFDALTDGDRVILPQIDLQRQQDLEGAAATGEVVRVPDDEAGGHVRWQSSTRMDFDIYPELGLEPGVYDITVTNPSGSQVTLAGALGAVERPAITEIVPASLCLAQGAQSFELRGSTFLSVGEDKPVVAIGPNMYTVESLDGCTALDVPLANVQACTTAVVTVPQGDLDEGTYDVTLTNPAPAACASSDAIQLEVTPPPVVESVLPLTICTGGGDLTITGTGFRDGAVVSVGGVPAADTRVVSETELQASFGLVGLDPGNYTLTVDGGNGCFDDFETEVRVIEGSVVFFVDPPVVFNGIETQVTMFVSGLDVAPTRVVIVADDGTETDLTDSIVFPRPGRVQARIPVDLAAGTYDVVVDDGSTCTARLPDGLTVTDQTILALEAIEPPFGHTGDDTGVELRAAMAPAQGEVQFTETPRAYLSPVGGGTAAQLESVAFVSPTRLTGLVPEGLPAGTYDVIAVNPAGEVGLLEGAFEVTADAPPEVDTASPGSLATSTTPQATTLVGDNFRNPAVALTCRLSDRVTEVSPTVAITNVDTTTTPETIAITVDTSVLDQGTSCAVRVTNDDGTFVDFAAITVTNPQQAANAISFAPGSALGTARRAPATTGGRASGAARFIYAIGGDDGTLAGAHATVEIAPVDLFGELGTWVTLPVGLPAGRTFARAVTVADRFIYLVGGHDAGAGATTASTLRAKILDPEERPAIDDIDLTLEDTGLDAGIWYYRLSAVMAAGAAQEPGGGEILASDPLVIQVPTFDSKQVRITLLWNAVPDAVEYRLYRTPMPGMASGDELLLATVPATETSFEDDGSLTPAGDRPLPLGSTGVWHDAGTLIEARQAHGLTLAFDPDPVANPGLFHMYAVAGDSGSADLETVERLSVTVAADGQQTVGAWTAELSLPAGTARRHLDALTADAGTASKVGADVWIYALGGSAGAGTQDAVHAVTVLPGGALDDVAGWTAIASMTPPRTGYGAALANNFLFALGGDGSETSGSKANICGSSADAGCGTNPDPPGVGGWTSLSDISMQPRAFMGRAVQSGFLYLLGGVDATGAPLATTDQSVLGGQP